MDLVLPVVQIESVNRKYVIGCILIMILHGTLLYGTLQIIVI